MKEYIDETPEVENLSEGWWESVMAEDACLAKAAERKAKRQSGSSTSNIEENFEEDIDWEQVKKFYDQEMVISCTVIDHNKGGLLVCSDHFQGFVPVSHLDDVLSIEDEDEREKILKEYVDCKISLKVIECDERRGRIVLSERAAQTAPGQRQKLLDVLKINSKVTGRVTNITDFGVFVDLGGVEGLIHISEISWGRVLHPKDHLSINEQIDVLVLQINRDQCRVSLSLKQLKANPWDDVMTRFPKGTVTTGVVTEVVKFGAFARLEDGLEGLIHISEMGIDGKVSPKELFTEGQKVNVEVVLIDPERQRMSLRLIDG